SITSYNQLLNNFNLSFTDAVEAEKYITTINFSHPLYSQGVFEKQVSNLQYPQVNSFYTINSKNTPILQFKDGKVYLTEYSNTYICASAFNENNHNVKTTNYIVRLL